jgi:hypothetical protein
VADADKLTEWLAVNVCEAERRPELVRDELLVRCRAEQIEPPAAGRVDRIVRSALHQAEQAKTARIVARLPVDVAGRLRALVAVGVRDDDTGEDSVLALIKSVPGNVSLGFDAHRDPQTARGPRDRPFRRAVRRRRAPGGGRLAGPRGGTVPVAPARPSRAADADPARGAAAHPAAGDHRHVAGAADLHGAPHRRPGGQEGHRGTGNAFKRVTGKENILFSIAQASLDRPDDPVRQVVYPAVAGGEQTLRELVHEFKTKGPVYRRTVQTTPKASYSNHYRRGLIELLDVLEFRSNNASHRPVLDALDLIKRHADAGRRPGRPGDRSSGDGSAIEAVVVPPRPADDIAVARSARAPRTGTPPARTSAPRPPQRFLTGAIRRAERHGAPRRSRRATPPPPLPRRPPPTRGGRCAGGRHRCRGMSPASFSEAGECPWAAVPESMAGAARDSCHSI